MTRKQTLTILLSSKKKERQNEQNMDYFCEECGKIIREDEVIKHLEESEAWGHPVYEEWLLCPECGDPVSEYDGELEDD